MTPKSSGTSSIVDKESPKKSSHSRAEFWRNHKKKIIAGAISACVVVVACVLGFKYGKKKVTRYFFKQVSQRSSSCSIT